MMTKKRTLYKLYKTIDISTSKVQILGSDKSLREILPELAYSPDDPDDRVYTKGQNMFNFVEFYRHVGNPSVVIRGYCSQRLPPDKLIGKIIKQGYTSCQARYNSDVKPGYYTYKFWRPKF